ncbi:MAG TPA: ankyrin repeat domain-containing protein [Methylophilaceae bacterium]|nr:ankyrin repeat domain-containing protein [Methylophilaceae bacterium]
MNMIKAILLAMAMMVSINAFAMTDEQEERYTEALRDGNVQMVKQFLDDGIPVDQKFYTWEALQIAANKNQMEVVKLLVDRGADVNYLHPITKMSALDFAAFSNNKKMVDYLISKGAIVNKKMHHDITLVGALRDEGLNDMADYMISKGSPEN